MSKSTISEFKKFLSTLELGVDPTLHINGSSYHTAVAVVDVGTPLRSVKLTTDQVQDITTRLRKLARELMGNRDVQIRVSNDFPNGIFWSSIT